MNSEVQHLNTMLPTKSEDDIAEFINLIKNNEIDGFKINNIKTPDMLKHCDDSMLEDIFRCKRFNPSSISRLAIESSNYEMCDMLLNQYNYKHLLQVACEMNKLNMINYILKYFEFSDEFKYYLIHIYYHDNNLEVLNVLLKHYEPEIDVNDLNMHELIRENQRESIPQWIYVAANSQRDD